MYDRRLRLAHVTPSYWPAARYGGPIVSVHGLCKALAARGHDVQVFTTNIDGADVSGAPTDQPVMLDGVRVRYFPAGLGRRLFRAPALAAALRDEIHSLHALHLHSVWLWPTTAAARLARRRGLPYVLSPRGMLAPELIRSRRPWLKQGWLAAFERRNVESADCIHVTSEAEARELRRLSLTPRRIALAPNGFEPPAILPKRSSEGQRVLYLGRLSWKKRLDQLVRALAYAPGAKLTIAGFDDESLAPELRTLAGELGLSDRVELQGPALGDDKWALLASSDIFALPSAQENFGISALEALGCGVPVVVSPGVGLAAAIVAAGAGLCVESEPKKLGEALERLLGDAATRAAMGAAGARLAREKYAWSEIAADMERLYLDIAAR